MQFSWKPYRTFSYWPQLCCYLFIFALCRFFFSGFSRDCVRFMERDEKWRRNSCSLSLLPFSFLFFFSSFFVLFCFVLFFCACVARRRPFSCRRRHYFRCKHRRRIKKNSVIRNRNSVKLGWKPSKTQTKKRRKNPRQPVGLLNGNEIKLGKSHEKKTSKNPVQLGKSQ